MNTQILDTRDLIEKRDELKEQILASFKETFEHYAEDTDSFEEILFEEEEIQSWVEIWQDELDEIEEINEIEENCTDFQYGETLIGEDYWEDYCREMIEDCGYISKDFPNWIEIDWNATANNMSTDYTTVNYKKETYYIRNV